MSQPKVQIRGVSKRFESAEGTFTALGNVNLDIEDEQFVSVVGPSGCGKSTLLEIIAGLQPQSEGEVLIDGQPVQGPGRDRAVVFQHYALFPWRTVLDNVAFPLEMAGVPRTERRERAMGHLRIVGLDRFARRHTWQLSGGMQQRVALARALACDPKILLMDEPFSGADAITRELLQDQLKQLHRETGKTIFFVTHSVDEAIHLSDRIAVMGTRPGRVVKEYVVRDELERAKGNTDSERAADLKDAMWGILREEILAGS